MKKIKAALTGGIGSGKSTVSKIFESKGITVINLDEICHVVMKPNTFAWMLIKKTFGNGIINNNHEINRSALADIVFKNKGQKALLEEIIHPFVLSVMLKKITRAPSQVVLVEAPLLVETGMHHFFDHVVTVHAPLNVRIERVAVRDKCETAKVRERIEAQVTDKDRFEISDYRIDSTATIAAIETEVTRMVTWWRTAATTVR